MDVHAGGRMDVAFYLGHGSPQLPMTPSAYGVRWMSSLATYVPQHVACYTPTTVQVQIRGGLYVCWEVYRVRQVVEPLDGYV